MNKLGELGEKLIKERLHNNPDCWINIQMNVYNERHFCDMSIQKWSLRRNDIKELDKRFDKIDVKTYPPLNKYPDYNGVNYKHFCEYVQTDNMLVLFVDPKNGMIYGEFVKELQHLHNSGRTIKIVTNQEGYDSDDRICWKISDLRTFNEIFEFSIDKSKLSIREINILNKLCKNKLIK